MSTNHAETTYICSRTGSGKGGCPPPAKPIKKEISVKRRHAQLIRLKGTFYAGNKHTANLPGTKRIIQPKIIT